QTILFVGKPVQVGKGAVYFAQPKNRISFRKLRTRHPQDKQNGYKIDLVLGTRQLLVSCAPMLSEKDVVIQTLHAIAHSFRSSVYASGKDCTQFLILLTFSY